MYKKCFLASALFFLIHLGTYGQVADSTVIKVCTYNLLNYGNYIGGCSSATNNINTKDNALSTIFASLQPDILAVNEIGTSDILGTRLLVNTLNVNGVNHYDRATLTNTTSANITNCVFFNSNKVGLDGTWAIDLSIRDANLYRFYVKEPNLSSHNDTIWLYVAVCHLKAGDTPQDASQRTTMANNLLNALAAYSVDYLVVAGDFNIYASAEQAYQNMLNHQNINIRLLDPINTPGNWHANSGFKYLHTQSTRSSGNNCFSGGGSDDRFDFVMLNRATLIDSGRIRYQTGSYKAFGQDGNRFNGSINSPTNQAVSSVVANALYNSSDHLPVALNLVVTHQQPQRTNLLVQKNNIWAVNPIVNNQLVLHSLPTQKPLVLTAFNTAGQQVWQKNLTPQNNTQIVENLKNWPSGMYFILVTDGLRALNTLKVIKN